MTSIETQVPPAVALSQEELWAVMRLIKAPWVPGIEPIDVQHPLDPKMTQAVEEGARALIARGFLTLTPPPTLGGTIQADLPSPVVGLVGACACSPFDLYLSLRRTNQPQTAHFHQVGALGVIHTTPQPDVHLLEPLAGRQGVLDAAAEMLGLGDQVAPPVADGIIAAPKLRQVHRAPAGTPPATIAQILREGGLSAPLVEAVTAALTSALSTGVIMVFRPSAGPTSGGVLGVIVAPDVCFTLTPEADATRYVVRPSSAAAIRAWIVSQLPK